MPDTAPSPTPESRSELMAGYVSGDLTPAEIERVEVYLLEHPERQAEIASLMPLESLPQMPTDLPPDSLRSKILQTDTALNSGTLVPITPLPNKPRLWWKPIAASLELSLIAYFGWYNYQLSQELATVKQDLKTAQIAKPQPVIVNKSQDRSILSLLQQPNNRLIPLKNLPAQTGAGSLLLVPQQSIAMLLLQQVKPLPPGQVYRTWAITGEQKTSCTDFLPDKDGKVLRQIPLDRLKKANKLTVTIEQKSSTTAAGAVAIEGEI